MNLFGRLLLLLATGGVTLMISTLMMVAVYLDVQQRFTKESQDVLHKAKAMLDKDNAEGCIEYLDNQPVHLQQQREVKELQQHCSTRQIDRVLWLLQWYVDNNRLEQAAERWEWLRNNFQDASAAQRQLIMDWEEFLCHNLEKYAKQQYEKAHPKYLNDALYPLESISHLASCYGKTQQFIKGWKAECSGNAQVFQFAEDLRREGNIQEARQQMSQISPHPYWQLKVRSFTQNLHLPYNDDSVCKP